MSVGGIKNRNEVTQPKSAETPQTPAAPETANTVQTPSTQADVFDAPAVAEAPATPEAGDVALDDPQLPAAEYNYESLIGQGHGETLEAVGVTDAQSFLDYQRRLGVGDPEAVAQFDEATGEDPEAREAILSRMERTTPTVRAGIIQGNGGQAEGWPEGITQGQAQSLESLGISAEDVAQGLEAVPHLIAAAEAAQAGDAAAAVQNLGRAAEAAPELVSKAVARLAQDLPEGPLKTAITEPAFATLVGQLAQGDFAAAAETLQNSPTLLDAAGELILELPQVKSALEAAGIDAASLPALSEVLPGVLSLAKAVQDGDVAGATQAALSLASQLDPEAFRGLADKVVGALPAGAREFVEGLLANPDVQQVAQALISDPNFPTLVEQLSEGDFTGALETLSQNTALMNTAGELLMRIPQVEALLANAGIDASLLPQLGEVLPDAIQLAQALRERDPRGATEAALKLASHLPPEAFQGLADRVMEALPEGARQLVEGILSNPDVQQIASDLLSDPNFPTLVEQLAAGDFTAALETLGENTALLNTVGDIITEIPAVKELLGNLGIDASKLPDLGEVLPQLLEVGQALADGDVGAALSGALELAGSVDLEAFRGMYERLSEQLPPEVKGLLDGILNDPAFSLENLQAAAAGIPGLLNGFELAGEGRWDEAFDAFGRAAQAGSPLVAHAVSRLAEGLEDGPVKQLLQDEALISNLIRTAPEVVQQLHNGDLAGAMTAIEANPELMTALQESPVISQLLTELGIPEALQDEALAGAPGIVRAMAAADRGDWEGAISELRTVAGQSPAILGHLGAKLAERLPEGPLRNLLSNGEFLASAVSDETLHSELQKVLSGEDVVGGLSGLLQNDTVANAAWSLLGPQLSQLGLSGPEDLKAIGGALPELAAAVQALQAGDIPGALESLHAALQEAAPEFIDSIVERAIDALPIDAAYKGILKAGLDILRSPEGAAALRGILDAVTAQPPNLEAFGQAMAQLGAAVGDIARSDPAKAENFLNALGALPGKIGALFRDPQLNHALAHSGALGHLFDAAEDLVNGRFTEAVVKLGDAAMALLGDPPSAEGLESFARLFRQVYEALPNAVKNKIQAAVTSAAGSLFGNIPIIGDLFDLGKDIHELIEEIKAGDQLGTILAAAQIGIDVAKFTQVGKPFVAPLEMAIGIVQGLEDAVDTIDEIRDELGNIMLLGQDNTPELQIDQAERQFLQEITPIATEYGMSPEQVMAFIEAHPEFRGRNGHEAWGLIATANAAGIPPEQFEEFLGMLSSQGASLRDIGFTMGTIRHSTSFGAPEMMTALTDANILAHLIDDPVSRQWLQDRGIDPFSRMADALFVHHVGRAPTEEEYERVVQTLRDAHAENERWGIDNARYELEQWFYTLTQP